MNIDEAIKHCEEIAGNRCDACGAEHNQLAKWLKELKSQQQEIDKLKDTIKGNYAIVKALTADKNEHQGRIMRIRWNDGN